MGFVLYVVDNKLIALKCFGVLQMNCIFFIIFAVRYQ